MKMEPFRNDHGISKVRILCDCCRLEHVETAIHNKTRDRPATIVEGRVLKKLFAKGWTLVGKTLRCPACDAERRKAANIPVISHEENTIMADPKVTEIRKPTREQKREIIAMLDICYSTERGRYHNNDTDKSVAETIGSGIMPGWVAEIREDLYGPDGGNDELEILISEISKWRDTMAGQAQELHEFSSQLTKALRDFNEGRGRAEDFLKRLDAIKAAVGPKAARA